MPVRGGKGGARHTHRSLWFEEPWLRVTAGIISPPPPAAALPTFRQPETGWERKRPERAAPPLRGGGLSSPLLPQPQIHLGLGFSHPVVKATASSLQECGLVATATPFPLLFWLPPGRGGGHLPPQTLSVVPWRGLALNWGLGLTPSSRRPTPQDCFGLSKDRSGSLQQD